MIPAVTTQLIDGLKYFFKEQKLSDRILQIIEIDEDFSNWRKRKFSDESCNIVSPKRLKADTLSTGVNDETINYEDCNVTRGNTTETFTNGTSDAQGNITTIPGSCNDTLSDTSSEASVAHNSKAETSSSIILDRTNCKTVASISKGVNLSSSDTANAKTSNKKLATNSNTDEIISISSDDIEIGSPLLHYHEENGREVDLSQLDHCYATFPVHSLILCINSTYFNKLLVDSGMKETSMSTVSVKVKKGEGKYLEMLIEAFYNQDILKNIDLVKLLSILDIASRFSCLVFIKQCLELLSGKHVKTLHDCNAVLQHIASVFEAFDCDDKYECIKNSCLKFLSKKLFPLELKFEEQDQFKSLSYVTIVYLLESKHAFTINENNALCFLYLWLQHNPDYQTSEIIELLLSNIRYELLTISFLCDELTVCDQLFNKWPGFPAWYTNVLKYHSLSASDRSLRGVANNATLRVLPSIKNMFFVSKHFVYDVESKCLNVIGVNDIVWAGLYLYPIITLQTNSTCNLLRLKFSRVQTFQPVDVIVNFHRKFEVYFAFLPGNVVFEESMLQSKRFVQRNVRKGEVQFKSKQTFSFHAVAKLDEDFKNTVFQYGLNLVLFFKQSLYTWIRFEMSNVKSVKKLINLKGSRRFSVSTEEM